MSEGRFTRIRRQQLKLVVASVLTWPTALSAQDFEQEYERPRPPPFSHAAGLRVDYDLDFEAWGVGGQYRLGLNRLRIELIPSGDVIFTEFGEDWQLNLDAAFGMGGFGGPGGQGMGLYGGGGLAIINSLFTPLALRQTKVGLNLLFGYQMPIPRTRLRPFIDARFTFAGGRDFLRIALGLNVRLGSMPSRPQR